MTEGLSKPRSKTAGESDSSELPAKDALPTYCPRCEGFTEYRKKVFPKRPGKPRQPSIHVLGCTQCDFEQEVAPIEYRLPDVGFQSNAGGGSLAVDGMSLITGRQRAPAC